MDDLDYLRHERLRVWEFSKALLDSADGRNLTAAEQQIWDDLNERLRHLDSMIAGKNTTYWNGASGPPVSAGGGGGSYFGMNGIRPRDRDAYMRGVHQGQEIIKAISEGQDLPRKIEVTALGDTNQMFIDAYATEAKERLDALPAERFCTACGIGEYSRIGAGPFGKDGICRYCAELKVTKHVAVQGDHPHRHDPGYPEHQHKRGDLVKRYGDPGPILIQPKPWPAWGQILAGFAFAGCVTGIVIAIICLVQLASH